MSITLYILQDALFNQFAWLILKLINALDVFLCFIYVEKKKEIFVSMGRDIAIKRTIVLVHVVKKEWGGGKFRQKHFSLQDLFFLFLYLVAFMCVLILRTHSWRHYLQKRHYSFSGKNMWIHCRAHMYHIVKVSSFQTKKITSKRFPTKRKTNSHKLYYS